jgi:hypothetical protein
MDSPFFAPIAKLGKFDLPLNLLLIFAAPVIRAFALGTIKFYQSFLAHLISL